MTTYHDSHYGDLGFSSWGDTGANEEPLDEILQKGCDIVITASRSKRQTVDVVERLAQKYNYQLYNVYLIHGESVDNQFHKLFIEQNAKAILDMIKIIKP